jgi:hypothetical protein
MKVKLLALLCLWGTTVLAQVKIRNLYFNSTSNIVRLDFGTQPPAPFYTKTGSGSATIGEGIAHVEDADGNIIIWVNANGVYDKNGTLMPGSAGILANPSSTEIELCPFPNDKNKFYVFYNKEECSSLYYSVVDLSQRGGLGDVISKNNQIDGPNIFAEGLEIIRIPCTNNYWLVAYQCYAGFKRFKIDASGIGTGTFIQSFDAENHNGRGELDYHNGKIGYAVTYRNKAFVADFDPVSGNISNGKTLTFNATNGMYGLEFSLDASKAYFTNWNNLDYFGFVNSDNLYQYDFATGGIKSFNIVYDTKNCNGATVEGLGQIELGKDGKLYIPHMNGCQITVIENPNAATPTFSKIDVNAILSTGVSDHIQSDFLEPLQISASKTDICAGETITLTATGGTGNFAWQPAVGISNPNNPTIQVSPSATITYKFFADNKFGCRDSAFVTIQVTPVVSKPQITASGKLFLCGANASKVKLVVSPSGQKDLKWYRNEQLLTQGVEFKGDTLVTSLGGQYRVEVNTKSLCLRSSDDFTLLPENLEADLLASGDTVFCKGGKVTLSTTIRSEYTEYQWYRNNVALAGKKDPTLVVEESGKYFVVVKEKQGCSDNSVEKNVEVLDIPEVNLGEDVVVCNAATFRLDAGNAGKNFTYRWSTGSKDQTLEVSQSGEYEVEVSNKICSVKDKIRVTLLNISDLVIYNFISPDNDSQHANETFTIEGFAGQINLVIYNRWGKEVYRKENYQNNWSADGLPSGVYYYHLTHQNNCFSPVNGWIQVVR